jgi:ubiquinone/menaquinone biosynthesis C-methylase UbiE
MRSAVEAAVITRARASQIAHGDLRFHNPVSPATVESVIAMLPLEQGDRVLDVGCGRGELLVRLAESREATGLGIDSAEEQIEVAREEASARVPGAGLRFELKEAADLDEPEESVALAVCIGSTHALGGLDGTLDRLVPLVRPGGALLIGEGFWALPPTPEYLEALGAASADELTDYTGLLTAGERHGLESVYAATASEPEWEHYEWANILHADDYARRHPDEPGVELLHARVKAARRRRELAAAHGETLGFALVVWRRRPPGASG